MKSCRYWSVACVAFGLLAATALGVERPKKAQIFLDDGGDAVPAFIGGGALPPGGAALPPTDGCPADDAGVLLSAGFSIVGTTEGMTDDFGGAGSDTDGLTCSGSWSDGAPPGAGGLDVITKFQVEATGFWQFQTCQQAVPFDTSLMVLEDTGEGCPGTIVACNGDGTGCPGFTSLLNLQLCAGTTYYLIIDGWSAGDFGDFEVLGGQFPDTASECPGGTDAECDDGLFCNGVETCFNACDCLPGPGDPCTDPANPLCNEETDVCENCATQPDPDGFCQDGVFCNGVEFCDEQGVCQTGPPGCERFQACDEDTTSCIDPDTCIAWQTVGTLPGSFSPGCFNDLCDGTTQADDMELSPHAGRELISYQVMTQARNLVGASPDCVDDTPVGTDYAIQVDLYTTLSGGACVPEAPIAGAGCEFSPAGQVLPGGSGGDVNICEPNAGLPTGIDIPIADQDGATGQCGVDVWMALLSLDDSSGMPLATTDKFIGGPGLDDEFGQTVVAFENCTDGVPNGTFRFAAFAAPTRSDWRNAEICTQPVGPCCIGTGGCELISEADCDAAGGAYQGDRTLSNFITCDSTGDDDGVADICDNCPETNNINQEDCDGDGEGDACEADTADQDSDLDGVCNGVDGCPNDPLKSTPGTGLGEAPGQCGCGNLDDDTDRDGTADCNDNCPTDPGKIDPGECGCGVADEGDEDDDGVLDCVDVCRGVDDAVFAPECVGAIPTVSEWGLVILSLLLLVAGKVYFGRRSATA